MDAFTVEVDQIDEDDAGFRRSIDIECLLASYPGLITLLGG
jgi:hypothetical protein